MPGQFMFDQIISKYGATAKAKLSSPAITGAPEDNIRAPLEELITALAIAAGQQPGWVTLVGESTLSALGTRPDYAVTVRSALTGFIELKAPGKGADPRKFTDPHDKRQWQKLKSLPNLLYSDGQSFSLWQNGALGWPDHSSVRRSGHGGCQAYRPSNARHPSDGFPELEPDPARQPAQTGRGFGPPVPPAA